MPSAMAASKVRCVASLSCSAVSACLRALMSREMPKVPTTSPPGPRRGPLVARKVAMPSLVLNTSSRVSTRSSSTTAWSLAMMAAALAGGNRAVSSLPMMASIGLPITRAASRLHRM